MILQTWSEVLSQSFQSLWIGVMGFVPNLIIAIIIFIIGWVVGVLFGRVVSQIIHSLGIDKLLRSASVEKTLNKAGFNLNAGNFFGALVKWFIIVVFAVAAFDVLGLDQVNLFLQQVVLLYLPRVIAAAAILLIAVIIADATENLVIGSAKAVGARKSQFGFLGTSVKWAIWVFAGLMALYQLGVASAFIQTLFTGLIVAISLSLGLAFGLGGKTAASDVIEDLRKKM
ncbi:MAG: hypothetical protein KAS02_00260 [Candidatus Pacebacteria bacterium]|nr:hypothetical protein [Candidatus Paceibacterota bacterium]